VNTKQILQQHKFKSFEQTPKSVHLKISAELPPKMTTQVPVSRFAVRNA